MAPVSPEGTKRLPGSYPVPWEETAIPGDGGSRHLGSPPLLRPQTPGTHLRHHSAAENSGFWEMRTVANDMEGILSIASFKCNRNAPVSSSLFAYPLEAPERMAVCKS